MTVTVDIDSPQVFTVTCEEPSHADRPYLVAALEPSFYGKNGVPVGELEEPIDPSTLTCLWTPARSVRAGSQGAKMKLKRGTTTRRTLTSEDELYNPRDADADHSTVRGRFVFKCDLCGLSLAHRAEKLEPVIGLLMAHGINTISLRSLAERHRRAASRRSGR